MRRRLLVKLERRVLRGRYLLLATIAGVAFAPQYAPMSDYDEFSYGGQALLGHVAGYHAGLHVYAAHPEFQIGPGPLAFAGVLAKLFSYDVAHYIWIGLTLACGLVAVRSIEISALRLGYEWATAARLTVLGGAAVLTAWSQLAVWGHLEEAAAISLVLMATAALISRRPWWVPAILIGSAVMCKPWAVVAAPLLLLLPRRLWLRTGLVTLVAAVICWIPFVLATPQTITALGSFPSTVMPHSALRVFGFGVGQGGPRSARSIEVLFGVATSALVVSRRRWLAVPLVGLSARVLLDPRWFIYYGVGLLTAALLWDVAEGRRWPAWTVAVGLLEFVVQLWLPAEVGAIAQLITALVIAIGVAFSGVRPARLAAISCRDCREMNCACAVHAISPVAAA